MKISIQNKVFNKIYLYTLNLSINIKKYKIKIFISYQLQINIILMRNCVLNFFLNILKLTVSVF